MNKLVKGAIAGAAGIALLLGGAGTFALWNSTTTVTGGTIVAGNLVVSDTSPVTAGYWTVNGGTTQYASLSAYKVIPGDVLKFTKTVNVTASGDNLVATLGLGTASITPTTAGNAADIALAGFLSANAVLTATGSSITGSGPSYTVTAGASGIVAQPVVVTATITFPKSATPSTENGAKTGSVNLNNLTVTLTQN